MLGWSTIAGGDFSDQILLNTAMSACEKASAWPLGERERYW